MAASPDQQSTGSHQDESVIENMTMPSEPGGANGGAKIEWAHNSQMLAVKDERKRAEYDVQLLANRLAYLRAEERAASKKVAETKKRTADISVSKHNARTHDKLRAEWKAQTKAKEDANREYFNMSRQQHRSNLKDARDTLRESHRSAAQETKRQSDLLAQQKNDLAYGDNARRRESHMNVKLAHEKLKARQAKRQNEHEENLKKHFENKVVAEKRRKDEAEKLIAQFEAEEAKLISRLKMTQVEQHGALTKLEKTLLSP
mmetsp:Transcript_9480/g.18638  ORF Transcript_9480/g.18638 Transcript_9480/m.18638 type:complete len:260 (-) Transcript_9480:38-817(-)